MLQKGNIRPYLSVFFSALLLGLSRLFPATASFSIVAFLPLFHFFETSELNWKVILKASALFSIVYTIVALHWIALVTGPGVFGMMILFTGYFFILFLLIGYIWKKLPYFRLYGFIFWWLSFEFLMTLGELRFPWFNVGYAFADYFVQIQVADIGGIYLISGCVLLINVFLYQIYLKKWNYLYALIALLILWNGYGIYRIYTIPLTKQPDKIAIMQPSIPQTEKWEPGQLVKILTSYERLTKEAGAKGTKLLIWPEASIPDYFLQSPELQYIVGNLSQTLDMDIFAGFPDALSAPENYPSQYLYYNSASLIHPDGKIDEPYRKNILVPVGERMPFMKVFPILWKVQFGQANWEYGKSYSYFQSQGHTFSPLICFEIAFPEFIAHMASHQVDYLVNITNDAWFYHSRGTYQHETMAKVRAVEIRKEIYRCANTGISTVIDPLGRTMVKSKLYVVEDLYAPLYTTTITSPYVKWGVKTPYFYLIIAIILFLLAIFRRKCRICRMIDQNIDKKRSSE
ncbi:MAG TPA: apolipoprotein N-acyltransferase [Candidatus Cloacimonadota bacterium]|nr:apolipoprotein N-acyltransferase [Candidatus Cloacimonadota bacterium]HPT71431.1 apolipoprotein N-acyltransferase [Candidatus Cloacimonadota bacterium]